MYPELMLWNVSVREMTLLDIEVARETVGFAAMIAIAALPNGTTPEVSTNELGNATGEPVI